MARKKYDFEEFRRLSNAEMSHFNRAKYLAFEQMLGLRIRTEVKPRLKDYFNLVDVRVGWHEGHMEARELIGFISVDGDDLCTYVVAQQTDRDHSLIDDWVANVLALFGDDEIPF